MKHKMKGVFFFLCMFAFSVLGAAAQSGAAGDENDPVMLLGISIQELLRRFGPPVSVYPVRGAEVWQDDIVFEYRAGDFYICKDRVWQVSLKQANGVKLGDAKLTINMVHGSSAEDKGAYIIASIPNRTWQAAYRYNIDAKGKISAIFLYRTDY